MRLQSLISRSGGGKSQLRNRIIEEFPKDYKTYVEPFCGALWVLLAEERPQVQEVVNDSDESLMTFWQTIKNSPESLYKMVCETPEVTRKLFLELQKIAGDKDKPADERAAAYFLILRSSYMSNGKSLNKGNVDGFTEKSKKMLENKILRVSERLKNVEINCKDFAEVIEKNDCKETFFYLDPPYFNCSKSMRHGFTAGDFERLCDILDNIKGKFAMSFDDCGFSRRVFKNYNFVELERKNNFTTPGVEQRSKPYYELLIKNY
jgi:DNA adenine methylase